jgi:hypothetical protein
MTRRARLEYGGNHRRIKTVTLDWKMPELKVALKHRPKVLVSRVDPLPAQLRVPAQRIVVGSPSSLGSQAEVTSVTVELFDHEQNPLPFVASF